MEEYEDFSYEWHREHKEVTFELLELKKAREERHLREAKALSKTKWSIVRWWINKRSKWIDFIDRVNEEELITWRNSLLSR